MAHRFQRLTTIAGLIIAAVTISCSSGVIVKRRPPMELHTVDNVAVLLFFQESPDAPAHLAEFATDAFSIEAHKYFPALVDRYKVREFMKRYGYEHGVTRPVARHLGEELQVDAVFVGTIIGYSEKESFFGWKGKPHFEMGCRMISTHTGEVMLTAQVDVGGSYVIPINTNQDRVVYGVRLLTKKMGLAERFGPLYVARDHAIWREAIKHYEKREFWDAADKFGSIVHRYGKSDLRDEAQFYLGRSLQELGMKEGARQVYASLGETQFGRRSLYQMMDLKFDDGEDEEVIVLGRRIDNQWKQTAENAAARYLSGLSMLRMGDRDGAIARLQSVPVESAWYRFARYALADPYRANGDTKAAKAALAAVAAPGAVTESDRRLRDKALVAIGDLHFSRGDGESAAKWYALVEGDYRSRASLGLAWVAAEQGDYARALGYLAHVRDDAPPRWRGEASILAGTCEARLRRFDSSAEAFESALLLCSSWQEGERAQAAARIRLDETRDRLLKEIEPVEYRIVALLMGDRAEGGNDQLAGYRVRHESLVLDRLNDELILAESIDPEEAVLLRKKIRERAEFSLAQIQYEQELAGSVTGSREGQNQ